MKGGLGPESGKEVSEEGPVGAHVVVGWWLPGMRTVVVVVHVNIPLRRLRKNEIANLCCPSSTEAVSSTAHALVIGIPSESGVIKEQRVESAAPSCSCARQWMTVNDAGVT